MKNKLILIITILSMFAILQSCTDKNKKDNIETDNKTTQVTQTVIKEDTEGFEYEYEIKNKCKDLANSNSSSFAITDDINFFISVTGNKNELKKNKDKVVEYLKNDTKYQSITLLMYEEGTSGENVFIKEKIK